LVHLQPLLFKNFGNNRNDRKNLIQQGFLALQGGKNTGLKPLKRCFYQKYWLYCSFNKNVLFRV